MSLFREDISSTKETLEEFLLDTLICLSNALHDKKLCNTIFKKSCNLLSVTFIQNDGIGDTNKYDFYKLTEQLEKQNKSKTIIENSHEYMLSKVQRVKNVWKMFFPQHSELLENGIHRLNAKISKDGFASWPITDAVYIWPWIHIIAIDIDLNFGIVEKKAFLKFIPGIIGCPICRNHYIMYLGNMIDSLEVTSCAKVLLALHTQINKTRYYAESDSNNNDDDYNKYIIELERKIKLGNFVYDKSLVNSLFFAKYTKDYIKIKSITTHLK